MSIFSRLANALSPSSEPQTKKALKTELASLKQEGRLHARHVVDSRGLITIRFPTGVSGTVRDISYGGLGIHVAASDAHKVERAANKIAATLVILGRETELAGAPVYWTERQDGGLFVGFQIHHDTPESLLALREVLEPIRWGGSMVAIGADVRNERYQGPEWSCLRGEGPTDLVLQRASDTIDADLVEGLLTFRIGSAYCDVAWRNGRLATSRSGDEEKASSDVGGQRMEQSKDLDPKTLRAAVCILLGVAEGERRQTQPFLDLLVKALGLTA